MPGLTPQEQVLVERIELAIDNPNEPPGEGFAPRLMVALFRRIVNLRDFAAAQAVRNAQVNEELVELRQLIVDLTTRVETLEGPPPP
jgi:predicted component of type VI protein secretion system